MPIERLNIKRMGLTRADRPDVSLAAAQVPHDRFCLGLLPTPVHRFEPPGLPDGVEMWIKRDDLTGMQLSGNKVGFTRTLRSIPNPVVDPDRVP
jgi:hypothetical protein